LNQKYLYIKKEKGYIMKKRALLVGLIIMMLVLSACNLGSLRRGDTDARPIDYHKGTQGLVLEFFPGTPPPRLYAGDPLSLIVKYANRGAYPITDGRLYVSGFDRTYVSLYPEWKPISAEGKSVFNPEGLISSTEQFDDPSISMPRGIDIFRQTFKVTACYKYRTEATAEVCVDPDPLRLDVEDKVCTIRDVSLSGGQGAPMAVTHIHQDSAKDRVQFKISVGNMGGGTVLASSGGKVTSLTACHSELKRDQVDKIEIEAWLSGRKLECKPKQIQLVGGKGYSFCSLTGIPVEEAYQTVLNVFLDYGYRSSMAKRVEILRLPGEYESYTTPYDTY